MSSNKSTLPSSSSCSRRNASLWTLSISAVLLTAIWGMASFGFEEHHIDTNHRVSATQPRNNTISFSASHFPPSYWPKFKGQRYVTLLDGTWGTANVSSHDLATFDSMNPNFDPSTIKFSADMPVPSCVDSSPPGYMIPRGVYFFRRLFHFDLASAGARLQFQGCSFYCRVWVNGQEVGDHRAGGYVAFTLDIPPQASVDNEIFVLTDDRFNKTTAPMHTGGDFFHYGGIMRSVELHALPPPREGTSGSSLSLWPWRVYATPNSLETVNVTLHLTDRTYTGPIDTEIRVSFDMGPGVAYAPKLFSAVDGVASLGNMKVPNPRVWSTLDPQLHTLSVEMEGAVLVERFGLRMFDIDEDSLRIRLNGEIIKLLGWGHHTQWPDTGGSPTDEQLDEDILLLKAAGANFVRGAHYPQDARWLDRLDENGMVMWCETLGPNISAADTVDPYFLKYQAQQMNEMLDNAINHASIAIWAYFNEGPSGENASCPAYQMNTDLIKSRDTSRLVSYASSEAPPKDVCFPVVDIVSINGYPEWYDKPSAKTYWSAFASYYKALGKTFLISESGVGAIYEWQDNETAVPWTCAYQAKALVDIVEESISDFNVSGLALWHFFDFKSTDFVITGNWENNTHCDYLDNVYPPTCGYIDVNISTPFQKPGGQNCKGVIDFWRRKKPSYGEVAKRFTAITAKTTQHR
ncbi:unnamed protein product [Cylindrotheca closterium]|uniref:Beta-galactosidase n=1 Tax=Cylindrotheca closterium TaxID=2856 RepID=A0AAD2FQP5_9STRA|nr:unnamed protein product [Cylindrotheca closterium]